MTLYIEALEGLAVLSALLFVLYGPWQDVCTDFGRQVLFEKRDALFDLASAGKLDFQSEQYRLVRRAMETLIRFAHEVTIARLVFLRLAMNIRGHRIGTNPILQTIETIENKEVRGEVLHLFAQVYLTTAAMVVFKSPVLMAALIICAPFVVLTILVATALGKIRRLWRVVENTSQEIGNTIQAEAEMGPYSLTAA